MKEDIVRFGDPLLAGLITRPDGVVPFDRPGVVLLSPGLLHRVGPNRSYVNLARSLASDGYNVLRFDFSGRGDSSRRIDNNSLEHAITTEVRAAINVLIQNTGVTRVVLIGHCSGAFISFAYPYIDERIAGVVAISPEGGDEDWVEFDRQQKEARYYANYYTRGAINDPDRWRRFLTGKADYASIANNLLRGVILNKWTARSYSRRNKSAVAAPEGVEHQIARALKQGLHAMAERQVPILLIHPDQSAGPALMRSMIGTSIDEMHAAGQLSILTIAASDHMFTPLAAQHALIQAIRKWLASNVGPGSEVASVAWNTPSSIVGQDAR